MQAQNHLIFYYFFKYHSKLLYIDIHKTYQKEKICVWRIQMASNISNETIQTRLGYAQAVWEWWRERVKEKWIMKMLNLIFLICFLTNCIYSTAIWCLFGILSIVWYKYVMELFPVLYCMGIVIIFKKNYQLISDQIHFLSHKTIWFTCGKIPCTD